MAAMLLGGALVLTQAEELNNDIYGIWKITRAAGTSDTFGLSERQIRAMVGKQVIISKKKFSFNGRTCVHPSYIRSMEETTTYFRREWQANAADLDLPNPVTLVKTGCNLFYPSGNGRIVVAEESGVFFEAIRGK